MQPDSELNQRPRKRQGTPTSSKDNEPGSTNKRAQTGTPTTTTPPEIYSRVHRQGEQVFLIVAQQLFTRPQLEMCHVLGH